MDIKKTQGFDSLIPNLNENKNSIGLGNSLGGPSFEEALNQVGKTKPTVNSAAALDGIKFSNHAIDRMRSRGISFNAEDKIKLNDAVNRAASKGSKDSLILMNDSALIVSVKNKTVVTVMDKASLKENVFTNIDSTIVM